MPINPATIGLFTLGLTTSLQFKDCGIISAPAMFHHFKEYDEDDMSSPKGYQVSQMFDPREFYPAAWTVTEMVYMANGKIQSLAAMAPGYFINEKLPDRRPFVIYMPDRMLQYRTHPDAVGMQILLAIQSKVLTVKEINENIKTYLVK